MAAGKRGGPSRCDRPPHGRLRRRPERLIPGALAADRPRWARRPGGRVPVPAPAAEPRRPQGRVAGPAVSARQRSRLSACPPDPAFSIPVSVEQVVSAERERDGLVVVLPGVVVEPVDPEGVPPQPYADQLVQQGVPLGNSVSCCELGSCRAIGSAAGIISWSCRRSSIIRLTLRASRRSGTCRRCATSRAAVPWAATCSGADPGRRSPTVVI
jgi:hypothetical protein